MKAVINFFKKYKIEILAFIIPIFIFGISCLFCKIWPFGQKFLATYDGSAQYPGFTSYFIKALKGSESLFYSFKGGLGYNFYATAIYYLFNPTNLLSVFFNQDIIFEYYTLIIFLRIGLSGFTMSKYLLYKNKRGFVTLLFSTAYALMAYNTLYFYNFMYFDTIVLLPLVILGLDRLIHKNKCGLYILFLSLSIMSNFYIGSMVCIFSLLYFIYQYILLDKRNRNKKTIINFVISSLLSGLICTFVILPVFFELMNGKVNMYSKNIYTIYNKFNLDAFASFYRLGIGAYKVGDQVDGYPNIYSSILVFVLTVLFFFNKGISKKEKIATGIFIGFFLLCFSFNLLDYAWQFFQKPIWYPNRYSFVFSFLLISIAYKSFNNIDDLKVNSVNLLIIAFTLALVVLSAGFFCKALGDISKTIFLALSVVCIIEYFLSIKNYKLLLFIIVIFSIEITANTIVNLKNIGYSKEHSVYHDSYNKMGEIVDKVESLETDENNFYRMEFDSWMNINNGALYNYNGLLYFNSLRNAGTMRFLEDYAGYKVQDDCSTRFDVYNPIYTSLLGFKYYSNNSPNSCYEKIDEKHGHILYKNDEALPLVFMSNSNIKNADMKVNEAIKNSNKILNGTLGTNKDYYKTILYDYIEGYWEEYDDNIKYVYYNDAIGGFISYNGIADKDYYLVINKAMRSGQSTSITINDKEYKTIGGNYPSSIKLNEGDAYMIKIYFSTKRFPISDLEMYLLDADEYVNWANEMKENSLKITKYEKDDYIKGTINVTSDKTTLFTTIPYDKGWNVYVDGVKQEYFKVIDTFIGLDLTEGTHTIEFRFIPRGFIIGSTVSILSIIGTIIFIKKKKA